MSGFTLGEILVALSLVTTAVLALLGLSLQSLQANRKALESSGSRILADQMAGQLAQAAENDPSFALWSHNSTTVPYSSTAVLWNNSHFQVTVYANDVVAAPAFSASQRLKKIRTEVLWKDQVQGRLGYGQLRAQSTLLVHEP